MARLAAQSGGNRDFAIEGWRAHGETMRLMEGWREGFTPCSLVMWRNSVLFAQMMPGVDGRVAIAFLLFAMHWAMWTFLIFVGTAFFFWFIQRRGYSMKTAWLRFRRIIVGNVRAKWSACEYNTRRLPNDMKTP